MGCCGNRKHTGESHSQEACVLAELPSAASAETPKTTLIKSEEANSLRFEGLVSVTPSHLSSAVNSLGGQLSRMKSLQYTGQRELLCCFLCKRPIQVTGRKYCDVCNDASASMPLPREDIGH